MSCACGTPKLSPSTRLEFWLAVGDVPSRALELAQSNAQLRATPRAREQFVREPPSPARRPASGQNGPAHPPGGLAMADVTIGAGQQRVRRRPCAPPTSARGRRSARSGSTAAWRRMTGRVDPTLAHAARLLREARQLPEYGVAVGEPGAGLPAPPFRVRDVVGQVAPTRPCAPTWSASASRSTSTLGPPASSTPTASRASAGPRSRRTGSSCARAGRTSSCPSLAQN